MAPSVGQRDVAANNCGKSSIYMADGHGETTDKNRYIYIQTLLLSSCTYIQTYIDHIDRTNIFYDLYYTRLLPLPFYFLRNILYRYVYGSLVFNVVNKAEKL